MHHILLILASVIDIDSIVVHMAYMYIKILASYRPMHMFIRMHMGTRQIKYGSALVEWQIVGLGYNLHACAVYVDMHALLPLPFTPSQPRALKCVQQQTRQSRPRSRSTVTSPPMCTILSHLLRLKPLEPAALFPCLSCRCIPMHR